MCGRSTCDQVYLSYPFLLPAPMATGRLVRPTLWPRRRRCATARSTRPTMPHQSCRGLVMGHGGEGDLRLFSGPAGCGCARPDRVARLCLQRPYRQSERIAACWRDGAAWRSVALAHARVWELVGHCQHIRLAAWAVELAHFEG